MKDYFNMPTQDMAVEWQICRYDDPARAKKMERSANYGYDRDSAEWYLHLLNQAQREGWIE